MKYAKIGLSSVLLVTLAFSAIAYAAAQQQNDHDFSVEYEFTIGASPDGVQKASAEDGLFNQPYDVEINNNGEIFVSDYQNHRIQKFKSDGSFLTNWGGFGTGNGQMAWPAGLAFD
jgi:hypothetical protein